MSRLSDFLASHCSFPASRLAFCLVLGSAASLGVFGILKSVESAFSEEERIIPSPRLLHLSKEETRNLPYPPDALPGARDVDSPYGTFRVYEWGPEDGPKVLSIHGISTPSIALAGLASGLVEKGCRVMLFDLFGRGHSSTPSPHIHPYTSALYTSQILLALHSSPLTSTSYSWTSAPITLIGYSLGGALAADYTSHFPTSIAALFLIAPGGLIRPSHISWNSRLLYGSRGAVPEWLVERMVARRLWTRPKGEGRGDPELELELEGETAGTDLAATELVTEGVKEAGEKEGKKGGLRGRAVYTSSHHQLLPDNPHSTVGAVVDWQIQHHAGFVPAFISSIRHAPIHGQQERWGKIGEYLQSQSQSETPHQSEWESIDTAGSSATISEKQDTKTLKEVHIILGANDPIIIADELVPDARAVLGEAFCKVKIFEGTGHEVAIERAGEIADLVAGVLGL